MWRPLADLIRRIDAARYRRAIERALALHLRGEVRNDGLKLKNVTTRLEIEWWARDIHPWDRDDPPQQRGSLFVRQSLADTEAAIARLFQALPQVDIIALTVLEPHSESVIMAGIAERSVVESDAELSVGMRLWQRGIAYHSDGFQFEPLRASVDLGVLVSQGVAG
ncbi:MAG: hypothetical protein ACLQVN_16290 [Bryobacteraceae bacterium]